MASNNPLHPDPDAKPPNRLPVILIAVCVVLITALVVYLEFGPKPAPQELALTSEARDYIAMLGLGNINMEAKEDYFGQKVLEITGNITNNGERGIEVIELDCIFFDYSGLELMRERTAIVSKKMGGLAPGATKSFRLPFDSVSDSWNKELPQLVVAGIDFE